MDNNNSILDVLNIPKHHLKWLSKSRTVCLVSLYKWFLVTENTESECWTSLSNYFRDSM